MTIKEILIGLRKIASGDTDPKMRREARAWIDLYKRITRGATNDKR